MRALRTYWGLIAAIYLVPVESLRGFTGLPLSNACALTDHTLTRSLPRVHGWVSSRCRAQNGSSRTDRAGGSGRGAGRGSYQPNKTTNFGALSTYKICASEWAADALAAWGVCPGVLFARGGDAGCARGRGGPLGGGRTLRTEDSGPKWKGIEQCRRTLEELAMEEAYMQRSGANGIRNGGRLALTATIDSRAKAERRNCMAGPKRCEKSQCRRTIKKLGIAILQHRTV